MNKIRLGKNIKNNKHKQKLRYISRKEHCNDISIPDTSDTRIISITPDTRIISITTATTDTIDSDTDTLSVSSINSQRSVTSTSSSSRCDIQLQATHQDVKEVNDYKQEKLEKEFFIYQISHKLNPKQFYIGSTKYFSARKYKHEKNVRNTRGKNYWCSLYQYIRQNGGWLNFDMKIIDKGYSGTFDKIRAIEQYYIDKYKPTLNTKKASKRHVKQMSIVSPSHNNTSSVTDLHETYCDTNVNVNLSKQNHDINENVTVSENSINLQLLEIKKYGRENFCSKHIQNTSSPTKTRTRAANLYIEINENISNELIESKVLQYVCKSTQSKNAFIQHSLQFLSWVIQTQDKCYNLLSLIKFIVKKSSLLDDWYILLKDKNMSFDTIRGRYNNISVLITLFNSSLVNVNDNVVQKFIEHCRIITRTCEFEITKALSKKSANYYIKRGLLPKNLKTDLLHMWQILLPLMNNIIQLSKTVTLKKKYYVLVLKCILFGFWAENANGRMRAIISMTMKQFKQMCRDNFNSSSQTKTLKQHGRQLVSLCTNSELLVILKLYVKHVRSQTKCEENNKEYVFLK